MIRTTTTNSQEVTAPAARPCCQDRRPPWGNVGFVAVEPPTQPGFDWKKWLPIIAMGLAVLLLLTRQPKKKRRRTALKKARAGYRQKVGRIEARYR